MDLYRAIYNIAIPFWDVVSDFLNVLSTTKIPFLLAWGPFWDWEFDIVSLLEVALTTGFTAILVYRVVRALTI